MITLHLEAETIEELKAKAMAALGIVNGVKAEVEATYPYEGVDDATAWKMQQEETARLRKAQQEEPVTAPPQPVEAKPVPDKPKRKQRATKPSVARQKEIDEAFRKNWDAAEAAAAAPDPVKEKVMADVDLMSFEEDDDVEGIDIAATPLVDTLANEKLKAEVIDRLADLFTAGKVKLLRSLLDTYGSGAKTFAEIDPGVFPKIRDAMQKGIDS